MKWKKIKEKFYRAGYRKLVKKTFCLPNGVVSDYDILADGPVAVIFPLTKENEVVLVKQYRPGPEEIIIDLPGGFVDKGETPLQAAKRELLEETGYTGKLKKVVVSIDDGYATMKRHIFVAKNCYKIQAAKTEDEEFIEVVKMGLPEFRYYLKQGKMVDTECSYLALDYLNLL